MKVQLISEKINNNGTTTLTFDVDDDAATLIKLLYGVNEISEEVMTQFVVDAITEYEEKFGESEND